MSNSQPMFERAERRPLRLGADTLVPEAPLPSQWQKDRKWSAEQNLLFAALEDAVYRVIKGAKEQATDRHLAKATEEWHWFMSDSLAWPFDFGRICEALGYHPDGIRRALKPSLDKCKPAPAPAPRPAPPGTASRVSSLSTYRARRINEGLVPMDTIRAAVRAFEGGTFDRNSLCGALLGAPPYERRYRNRIYSGLNSLARMGEIQHARPGARDGKWTATGKLR